MLLLELLIKKVIVEKKRRVPVDISLEQKSAGSVMGRKRQKL